MKLRVGFAALVALIWTAVTAEAHRIDEYLQATRLSIEPDRLLVKMDLTPGIDVAPAIVAKITTSRDHRISTTEGQAYVRKILSEVSVELDGRKQSLELIRSEFPTFEEMSAGVGTIRLEARVRWTLNPGPHRLFVRNDHRPDCGVYLVNALVPTTAEIVIGDQRRDPLQREIQVTFQR